MIAGTKTLSYLKVEDVDVYYKFLLRYIMIYPIAAACSVKVKDRNTKFVEEYVFPQLFMQWIRETDEFDGVRYKSSLNTSVWGQLILHYL